jgi:hypothetical protein
LADIIQSMWYDYAIIQKRRCYDLTVENPTWSEGDKLPSVLKEAKPRSKFVETWNFWKRGMQEWNESYSGYNDRNSPYEKRVVVNHISFAWNLSDQGIGSAVRMEGKKHMYRWQHVNKLLEDTVIRRRTYDNMCPHYYHVVSNGGLMGQVGLVHPNRWALMPGESLEKWNWKYLHDDMDRYQMIQCEGWGTNAQFTRMENDHGPGHPDDNVIDFWDAAVEVQGEELSSEDEGDFEDRINEDIRKTKIWYIDELRKVERKLEQEVLPNIGDDLDRAKKTWKSKQTGSKTEAFPVSGILWRDNCDERPVYGELAIE